jgi:hypothetical protein
MFKKCILIAALGLTGVLTAQAAPATIISYLPFTISAPGNYVLASNLAIAQERGAAITILISETTGGPILLDFKGFTLTGAGDFNGDVGIEIQGDGIANKYPITIQNGTVLIFAEGITATQVSKLAIKNMAVRGFIAGLGFDRVANSSVSNCQFSGSLDFGNGIVDGNSPGGNSYNNIGFDTVEQPFTIENDPSIIPFPPALPLVLTRYQPSPSTPTKNECSYDTNRSSSIYHVITTFDYCPG